MKHPWVGARFRVGDWVAHPSSCRVSREGQEIRVQPRSMDVLVYLAERAGDVVLHDDLLKIFWRGRVSSRNAIHKCVNELRRVFVDARGAPRYIETISKRGYRLVAPIGVVPDPVRPAHLSGWIDEGPAREVRSETRLLH